MEMKRAFGAPLSRQAATREKAKGTRHKAKGRKKNARTVRNGISFPFSLFPFPFSLFPFPFSLFPFLPRELSVLDPMRLIGFRAKPAVPIRFVVLVVALEPDDLAVAFESKHVRRDAIEKPAVVADHH